MEPHPYILMVEDEEQVAAANARLLRRRGYEVETAATLAQAREQLSARTPDLLVLDIMLPDGSGMELCHCFRQTSDRPVLFLTGKTEVKDKVEALGLGGDYYLTKPYSFDEFLAVIARLLERDRAQRQRQAAPRVLRCGPLQLEPEAGRVTVAGEEVELTATEFSLLRLLLQNEGQVLSPHLLYESLWGVSSLNDSRTIRKHIFHLRAKLSAGEPAGFDIVSVYGKGYVLTRDV